MTESQIKQFAVQSEELKKDKTMTNEQEKARELAGLLNASISGKQLQYFESDSETWYNYDIKYLNSFLDSFACNNRNFRIKPETKTSRIPLSREDILKRRKLGFEAMWITDNGKDYSLIVGISHDGVYRRTGFITFREMMQRYTFSLDNYPCYKEVECE